SCGPRWRIQGLQQEQEEDSWQSLEMKTLVLVFLLGGIGEINAKRQKNFLVVTKETSIAEEIRHILDAYDKAIPAILEIPSKEHPYDPSKDSILRRAKGLFSAEDFK
ncbi:V-type proton ATPase subunit F, partial [Acropora cervicornis]